MNVSPVINNRQSFGMSFSVDEASFLKANVSETKIVGDVIKKIGQDRLDDASKYTNTTLSAELDKEGKISLLHISSTPLSLIGRAKKFLYESININEPEMPYRDILLFQDIDDESLLYVVRKTQDGSIAKFGSTEKNKDIFG